MAQLDNPVTYSTFKRCEMQPAIVLFRDSFTDSEGADEGQVIADLVENLVNTTAEEQLYGFVALSREQIVGAVFFSQLILSEKTTAFLLSPMAVATEMQKCGIGQSLIIFGLNFLKSIGVKWVFTYGDPAFYGKAGFEPVSEMDVAAPYPLSQPQGWLVRTLTSSQLPQNVKAMQCVEAFRDPTLW